MKKTSIVLMLAMVAVGCSDASKPAPPKAGGAATGTQASHGAAAPAAHAAKEGDKPAEGDKAPAEGDKAPAEGDKAPAETPSENK